MTKRDQDELRKAVLQARQPLPSYTEEEERSVVEHVAAIKRYKDKGGSHANLVADTLTDTLDNLPEKDRIKFLYAVIVLLLAMLAAFVVLKIKGVW